MLGLAFTLMIVVTFTDGHPPDTHQQAYKTLEECKAGQNQLYDIATGKGFIADNHIATFGAGCVIIAPKTDAN